MLGPDVSTGSASQFTIHPRSPRGCAVEPGRLWQKAHGRGLCPATWRLRPTHPHSGMASNARMVAQLTGAHGEVHWRVGPLFCGAGLLHQLARELLNLRTNQLTGSSADSSTPLQKVLLLSSALGQAGAQERLPVLSGKVSLDLSRLYLGLGGAAKVILIWGLPARQPSSKPLLGSVLGSWLAGRECMPLERSRATPLSHQSYCLHLIPSEGLALGCPVLVQCILPLSLPWFNASLQGVSSSSPPLCSLAPHPAAAPAPGG